MSDIIQKFLSGCSSTRGVPGRPSYDPSKTIRIRNLFPFPSSGGHGPWLGYGAVLLLHALGFTLWRAEPIPGYVHGAGIAVWATASLPITLWYSRKIPGAPLFELICLVYGGCYSVPLYLQFNQIRTTEGTVQFAWGDTFRALLLVLLGLNLMLGAYYGATYGLRRARLPRVNLPLEFSRCRIYLAVMLLGGLAANLLHSFGIRPSTATLEGLLLRVLAQGLYVALVLLYYQLYTQQGENHRPIRLQFLLGGTLTLLLCTGLSSGMLGNALVPLALLGLVRWHSTRRVPVLVLLLAFGLAILFTASKAAYRADAWNQPTTPNPWSRVGLWLGKTQKALEGAARGENAPDREVGPGALARRFNFLKMLTRVITMTPSQVPYHRGSTFAFLGYGWVPRIFWPTKPIANGAYRQFAQEYRLVDRVENPRGSYRIFIGFGHLAEGYANFGVSGLVLVMLLEGLFFAAAGHLLNGPDSAGGRAVYLSALVYFLNGVGAPIAPLFVGTVYTLLANAVLLALFLRFTRSGKSSLRAEPSGDERN